MDILPELVARCARCGIAADPLSVGQVQRLLCAATFAPSCANTQPWRIVAVTSERRPAGQRRGLEEIAFSDSWEKPWGTGDLDLRQTGDLV